MANTVSNAAAQFQTLPLFRQIGLFLGLSVSIALGLFIVNWSQEQDYLALYPGLSSRQNSDMLEVLEKSTLNFKVEPSSGNIFIAKSDYHKAKMDLAQAGLPKLEGTSGFLQSENGFTKSQFLERAQYTKSIEQEIAKTIESLDMVKSARVHLAMQKNSNFLRDKQDMSAAVFVSVLPGYKLSDQTLASIASLVAASVPGLFAKNVSVVDQSGNLLNNDSEDDVGLASKQLEYVKKIESNYAKRLNSLLEPLFGGKHFTAQVSAVVDFTDKEETIENYDPNKFSIRSENTIVQQSGDKTSLGGVPGALSNQPPAPGDDFSNGAADVRDSEERGDFINSKRQASRNYEVDRHIQHIKKAPASVVRLSVAVVIDYRAGATPEEPSVPLTANELQQIEFIVKDAVGFVAERGDSVNIINIPFKNEVIEFAPPVEIPIWQQDWFIQLMKTVFAGLFVLIMIFRVLLPIMRMLASNNQQQLLENDSKQDANLQLTADGSSATSRSALPGALAGGNEHSIEDVKKVIAEDPKKVAQVIMNWVGAEDNE